jgi:hypothetical protein
MRFIIAAIALLVLGVLGWYSGYAREVQGELRCEGMGAVMARIMRSTAWRVGATLQSSASGTAILTQKPT